MKSIWQIINQTAHKSRKYPQLDVWVMTMFRARVYVEGFVHDKAITEFNWPSKELTEEDHNFHFRRFRVRFFKELKVRP
jgi:hypothetical protein